MSSEGLTAVLLAAGIGSRIADLTTEPKVLLKVNGKSLLDRHIEAFIDCGLAKLVIVVGYKQELIINAVQKYKNDIQIEFVENADYRVKGNSFSLYMGVKEIEKDILIFDADLFYAVDILQDFIVKSAQESSILVGKGHLEDIECAKVLIDENSYVRKTIDKRLVTNEELSRHSFLGEAIGIIRINREDRERFIAACEKFLQVETNWPLNWEHLLNEYFIQNKVGYVFTNDGRWIEIDTLTDYKQACEL
ncbi:phosphocholine cytidylyltransferase family protein [Paenibacillus sp. FSL H8-0537]|uniref:phosphocholine cytidylyltransferase family protein n=1 Tax=Paenibacillus sp. FSL H8-0537 TaxID=2921399 RepID=UPI003101799A